MSRFVYLGVLLLYAQYSLVESSEENFEVNDDNIFTLNDKNFNRVVMESDDVWLVQFYAPWCLYCKTIEPNWKKAAIELKGRVKFGSYDVTTNTIKTRENRIEYYPTIKYFPFGLKDLELVSEYLGETNSEDLVSWITKMLKGSNPNKKFSTLFEENNKNRVKRDADEPKLFIPKYSCSKRNSPNEEL